MTWKRICECKHDEYEHPKTETVALGPCKKCKCQQFKMGKLKEW